MQGLSIVGYGTSQVVQNTPGSSPLSGPVPGHGQGFTGCAELSHLVSTYLCRMLYWAEKFLKKLPHLPHLPRSKLSEKRLSFEICGSLVDFNLPRTCRTCRICPRWGRLRDESEARSEPLLVFATV